MCFRKSPWRYGPRCRASAGSPVSGRGSIASLTTPASATSREQTVAPRIEPASGSNPEVEAIDSEQLRRLWNTIRDLPLPDRQIIVLYLEGMTAADIEGVTGFSAGSIATRLTRIRHRLAIHLRGEEVRG
ncbi:MAG: sigma-70 family RNA polymerase sigma factor [Bryobacterales bacterium]|nr:sigma-70 family RNA polymerase sigma factor [Bryobacterales bacterium]